VFWRESDPVENVREEILSLFETFSPCLLERISPGLERKFFYKEDYPFSQDK
jgi:ribosome maturation factor RimP